MSRDAGVALGAGVALSLFANGTTLLTASLPTYNKVGFVIGGALQLAAIAVGFGTYYWMRHHVDWPKHRQSFDALRNPSLVVYWEKQDGVNQIHYGVSGGD